MKTILQARFFSLFCFAVIAAQPARGEVVEKFDYVFYAADAAPGRPLYVSLNSASPVRQYGQVFHGHTKWDIFWHLHWYDQNGSCRLTDVTTELKVKMTLPRLSGGSYEQRDRFNRYLAALKTHEYGHLDIGRGAARDIQRKLSAMPQMATCSMLESTANQIGHDVIRMYAEREVRYDRDTGHGKSQGAWLSD